MASIFESPTIVDVTHGRGRVREWNPKPGFYVSKIEGHFDGELCDAFVAPFDAAPKDLRFTSFHDWREMSGFDRMLPARLVAFTLGHLTRTERLVIATRSTLVAMAVRAGNLTLRRIELVEADAFDASLAAALAR